jgi:hypothetical protein
VGRECPEVTGGDGGIYTMNGSFLPGLSRLSSQLLRRQRSGGSRLEASQGKWFKRSYLEKLVT